MGASVQGSCGSAEGALERRGGAEASAGGGLDLIVSYWGGGGSYREVWGALRIVSYWGRRQGCESALDRTHDVTYSGRVTFRTVDQKPTEKTSPRRVS